MPSLFVLKTLLHKIDHLCLLWRLQSTLYLIYVFDIFIYINKIYSDISLFFILFFATLFFCHFSFSMVCSEKFTGDQFSMMCYLYLSLFSDILKEKC